MGVGGGGGPNVGYLSVVGQIKINKSANLIDKPIDIVSD